MHCTMLMIVFVVSCLELLTTALHQSCHRHAGLHDLKGKVNLMKKWSSDRTNMGAFPEMEMLLATANVKVIKTREEKPFDEATPNTADLQRQARKAEKENLQKSVEDSTQMSSSAAIQTIKSMIHLATDGLGGREQFDVALNSRDTFSSQQRLIADIEDAKSRVSYVDKHGQRYKVPISSKPLWFSVAVRGGKEKKAVEAFQQIIQDVNHPLNAYIVDSFVHVRPGVAITSAKQKKKEKVPVDISRPSSSVLSGGKYGYAPKETNQHFKLITLPTTKGLIYVKAAMNPVIRDMILQEIPYVLHFASDDDGVIYPVVEKLIQPLLADRDALFPEEQQLAQRVAVGSYVQLKPRQGRDAMEHLGYGYVVGTQDGYLHVAVKCARRDWEDTYDIRDVSPMDNVDDSFREQDERSRIKQMLETLMEEEPRSRILRDFKRRGILDDFLYPERRAMREKLANQQRPTGASPRASSSPSKPTNNKKPLSLTEAQVVAAFGGIDRMEEESQSIERLNNQFERASRRKRVTVDSQPPMLSASIGGDDFSFLDELFPSSPSNGAQGAKPKGSPPAVAPESHDAVRGAEDTRADDEDMQDWQPELQSENKIAKSARSGQLSSAAVHGNTREDPSSLSDELDDWLRELERSPPEKTTQTRAHTSGERDAKGKEATNHDSRPRVSLRRRQQQREHEEIAGQAAPSPDHGTDDPSF